MEYLEKTASTVEEATALALAELRITAEQADIQIIEGGSKGFLGLGKKEAVVRVKSKFNPEELATNFLKELTISMNVVAQIQTKRNDKNMYIEISGDSMGILIGKRGQTLESIQYLTNLVVNKGLGAYVNVIIDIENYREKRKKNLEKLALGLAKKAKATKKIVTLEPMSAIERRIIHSVLEKDRQITTYSKGNEPYRYIVIEAKVRA